MNKDVLKGMWKQVRGSVKQTWGKLTDDDIKQIDGSRDKLTGKLQERYGYSRDEAEHQIDRFLNDPESHVSHTDTNM